MNLDSYTKAELLEIADLILPKVDKHDPDRPVKIIYKGKSLNYVESHDALLSLCKAFYKLSKGEKRGVKALRGSPVMIATAVRFLTKRGMRPTDAKEQVQRATGHGIDTIEKYCRVHKTTADQASTILVNSAKVLGIHDDSDRSIQKIINGHIIYDGLKIALG